MCALQVPSVPSDFHTNLYSMHDKVLKWSTGSDVKRHPLSLGKALDKTQKLELVVKDIKALACGMLKDPRFKQYLVYESAVIIKNGKREVSDMHTGKHVSLCLSVIQYV